MSLLQAVQNNNDGVRLMLEGKNKEAAQTFTASLVKIKTLLNGNNADESFSHGHSNMEQEQCETASLMVHSSEVEVSAPFGTAAANSAADEGAFVFTKAIVLSAPREGCLRPDSQFLNTHSACCIFNVALLHHRLAMVMGRNHASLLKAEHMYKMCIKLLQDTATLNGGCRTAMTVLVASKNNLTQIQLSLGLFPDARDNLEELSRLLYRVQHRVFSPDTWNGLFTNTLMLQAANVAPAA